MYRPHHCFDHATRVAIVLYLVHYYTSSITAILLSYEAYTYKCSVHRHPPILFEPLKYGFPAVPFHVTYAIP